MARKPKTRKIVGTHIYWRLGNKVLDSWAEGARAYADFRSLGGGREALSEPGATWGTTDPEIAEELFRKRRGEWEEKKRGRVGVKLQKQTTLGKLAAAHLVMKKKAGSVTDKHLGDVEARLRVAVKFFGTDRDPATITAEDVRAWDTDLAKSGKRGPGTRRHYLNALSNLYSRAAELLYVEPKYNPVAMIVKGEKPSGVRKSEAKFFEVDEAALILEAARVVEGRDRINATPALHALVATMLLTGGRWSEIAGLDVEDVSFDRGIIRIRPNDHRRIKTSTSIRTVPIFPQLREILQAHLFGGESPRVKGLVFPGRGGAMVGDIRKSLDQAAELCGMEAGEIRTRMFRHTYCSARLQTVQRILRPGADPSAPDAWEYVEVSKFQVQKEMGHGGAQLVDRVYGHAQRSPLRSEVVEYRVGQHREALGDRLRSLEAGASQERIVLPLKAGGG